MSDKFLPCPFCGSTDIGITRTDDDSFTKSIYVYCNKCDAERRTSINWKLYGWEKRDEYATDTKIAAIKCWNRRT